MRRDPRVRLKASDERQAQSMMAKIERYTDVEVHWYPQTSAKTESLTRMPTAEKAVKERGCTLDTPTIKQQKDL